jgi:SPP1 family predicted phage head-tail adaptor
MTRIGNLRHRIRLQGETPVADAGGGATSSWSDLATLSAAIQPLSGGEASISGAIRHGVSHEVTIRYRPGVHTGQRLVFDGRIFRIRAILNPEERNRFLKILCEEGA